MKDCIDFLLTCGREQDADDIEALIAERDSLRARIEGAPAVKARGKIGELCTVVVSHDLAGKRVRLVVEGEQ